MDRNMNRRVFFNRAKSAGVGMVAGVTVFEIESRTFVPRSCSMASPEKLVMDG